MCLKKYCECYQASIPCSTTCTCLHCCNQSSSASALLVNGINYSAFQGASTPIPNIPPRPESEDVLARAARDLELLRCLTSASKALFDVDKQVNVQLLELHRPQIEKALSSITTDVSSGLPPLPPGKSKRSIGQMENNNSYNESPAVISTTNNDNSITQHSIRSASPNSINIASALSLLGAHNQQLLKSTPKLDVQTHIQDTTSEEDYDNSSDSSEYRDKHSYEEEDSHLCKKLRTLSDDWVENSFHGSKKIYINNN